jgi:hypothetical protein
LRKKKTKKNNKGDKFTEINTQKIEGRKQCRHRIEEESKDTIQREIHK